MSVLKECFGNLVLVAQAKDHRYLKLPAKDNVDLDSVTVNRLQEIVGLSYKKKYHDGSLVLGFDLSSLVKPSADTEIQNITSEILDKTENLSLQRGRLEWTEI